MRQDTNLETKMTKRGYGFLTALMLACSPISSHAQVNCVTIVVPDGAKGVIVRGHSATGPRCFDFTPGAGRVGTIAITEGNGTLTIEGMTTNVKRFEFASGPWTYYISVDAEPFGSAGGPFAMQVNWR